MIIIDQLCHEVQPDAIYPSSYYAIREALAEIQQHHLAKAKILVDRQLQLLPSMWGSPEGIQALFFLEALRKRLDPDSPEVGNLYLMADQGQQIKMFNFMASKFPLVFYAQDIINSRCTQEMSGETTVTLLDIGIGTGQQMANILRRLSSQGFQGKKITILGVEPSQASLQKAEQTLCEVAQQEQLPFQFIGCHTSIEHLLADEQWPAFEHTLNCARADGKLLINASFALHHIRPIHYRERLFRKLRKMAPSLFTMIEPYADFVTPNLLKRFDQAWRHYGLTFSAIDQIDAPADDQYLLKQIFFSREIHDVLYKNRHRTEQFETGEMWLKRLKNAGFTPACLTADTGNLEACPFVSVHSFPEYTGLCVQKYPIISIIAAQSM